jgi:hypothetical protein
MTKPTTNNNFASSGHDDARSDFIDGTETPVKMAMSNLTGRSIESNRLSLT